MIAVISARARQAGTEKTSTFVTEVITELMPEKSKSVTVRKI